MTWLLKQIILQPVTLKPRQLRTHHVSMWKHRLQAPVTTLCSICLLHAPLQINQPQLSQLGNQYQNQPQRLTFTICHQLLFLHATASVFFPLRTVTPVNLRASHQLQQDVIQLQNEDLFQSQGLYMLSLITLHVPVPHLQDLLPRTAVQFVPPHFGTYPLTRHNDLSFREDYFLSSSNHWAVHWTVQNIKQCSSGYFACTFGLNFT